MDFDLTLQEEPVTIKTRDGVFHYVLTEATEDIAVAYRNLVIGSMSMGPEGKPQTVKGIADGEPFLVAGCLRNAETGGPVSEVTIRSWPSKVVKALFNKAQEISGLQDRDDVADLKRRLAIAEKAEEEAKNPNGLNGTMNISD